MHVDGADVEELTYRVSFGAPDPDGRQALRLHALTGQQARDDSAAGQFVLEGRTGETASYGFAGFNAWDAAACAAHEALKRHRPA